MRTLIAIPVFNERKYVEQVIDKVHVFHPDVLLIDDGSSDGTADYLATRKDVRLLRHKTNKGYGHSLIDAFRAADRLGYDWVITMDCDEQHEPEMIPVFLDHIRQDKWDLISGSRYLHPRANDDLPPTDRRSINHTITHLLNDLLDLGLTDAFCGFKAHRVAAMRKIRLTIPGYAFPMQLWPQIAAANLRLLEIPVRLIYNDPNRHFGGKLDDAQLRLQHYLNVLTNEMERVRPSVPQRQPAKVAVAPSAQTLISAGEVMIPAGVAEPSSPSDQCCCGCR